MNVAVAHTRRLAVSPYARRLARERALPLEAVHGSGPDGRILAVDVLRFVPIAEPVGSPTVAVTAAAPPVAAPRIAAFAASIALGALKELLAALESTGKPLDIDDILLRAAGRAFAEIPDIAKGEAPVALELAGRQMVASPETPLTSLREARLAALADDRNDAGKPAALSLCLLPATEIRPVTMPLLMGRVMRLTVSVSDAGDHAECLLTVDTASVDEVAASTWLSVLKSAMENPLRLFV